MSHDGPIARRLHPASAPIAEFRVRSYDGVAVFEVEGELDLSNAEELAEALSEAVAEDPDSMLVDLSAVSFIDSSGIRAIFAAGRRLGDAGRPLRVVVPPDGIIRRTLLLSEVPKAIPIDDSLEAGLHAVTNGPRATS